MYYNTIDSVVRELERRFSERNSQLASALAALNPEADNFLDVKAVKHILDLSQSIMIDAEFEVAKEFLMSQKQATQRAEHIRTMLHERKARLVQFAFEKDLTHKCTSKWKDTVLRQFSSNTRHLHLF